MHGCRWVAVCVSGWLLCGCVRLCACRCSCVALCAAGCCSWDRVPCGSVCVCFVALAAIAGFCGCWGCVAAAACVLRPFLGVLRGFYAVLLYRYRFKLRAAVRDSMRFCEILRKYKLFLKTKSVHASTFWLCYNTFWLCCLKNRQMVFINLYTPPLFLEVPFL